MTIGPDGEDYGIEVNNFEGEGWWKNSLTSYPENFKPETRIYVWIGRQKRYGSVVYIQGISTRPGYLPILLDEEACLYDQGLISGVTIISIPIDDLTVSETEPES